jgi:hypothetical protein
MSFAFVRISGIALPLLYSAPRSHIRYWLVLHQQLGIRKADLLHSYPKLRSDDVKQAVLAQRKAQPGVAHEAEAQAALERDAARQAAPEGV